LRGRMVKYLYLFSSVDRSNLENIFINKESQIELPNPERSVANGSSTGVTKAGKQQRSSLFPTNQKIIIGIPVLITFAYAPNNPDCCKQPENGRHGIVEE
jgi:hypothetical protein